MKKLYSNKLIIFSLVLPGMSFFLFAVPAPICLSVYYGFTDYTGMGEAHLIGWENYVNLFHDSAFGRSLRNSLFLAIGFICIQHPIAIVVAAVLDKLQGKAEGIFRCIYFIPNVISVAVIAYLRKYTLRVVGVKKETYMIFRITDTGVGMNEEQMAAIWDKEDTRRYASQRIGRYAIKNVKERLALVYQDDYELRIESKEGQGTTVTVSVPCGLKESRKHEHQAIDCG